MIANPRTRAACPRPRRPSAQRGAVLIVSLILLAVLTLLGLSTMSTTSLEEKMAANTQESTRAFQIAETGLARAFGTKTLSEVSPLPEETIKLSDSQWKVGEVTYAIRRNGEYLPPVGSLFSAKLFRSQHFDVESTGKTWSGDEATPVRSVHHAGAYQIIPNFQN